MIDRCHLSGMPSYWFGDVTEDGVGGERPCHPRPPDPGMLARRMVELSCQPVPGDPPDWQVAVSCGFVQDRAEYLALLHRAAMIRAREDLATALSAADIRLIQMVRTLDGVDGAIHLLTERTMEWFRTTAPDYSGKYRRVSPEGVMRLLERSGDESLRGMAREIRQLARVRNALSRDVASLAGEVLPNCTALAGGVVAARLVAASGGLASLARMPGATIQVLGAKNALFSHLTRGTPPPKHGILYQHRRVHAAPRGSRGRVARVLAAKMAIAARLDLYRGEPDNEFLNSAQEAVDRAMGGGSP